MLRGQAERSSRAVGPRRAAAHARRRRRASSIHASARSGQRARRASCERFAVSAPSVARRTSVQRPVLGRSRRSCEVRRVGRSAPGAAHRVSRRSSARRRRRQAGSGRRAGSAGRVSASTSELGAAWLVESQQRTPSSWRLVAEVAPGDAVSRGRRRRSEAVRALDVVLRALGVRQSAVLHRRSSDLSGLAEPERCAWRHRTTATARPSGWTVSFWTTPAIPPDFP